MKNNSFLFLCLTILLFCSCKKEYRCRCTSTNVNGEISSSLTTIEARNESSAEEICEGLSVNSGFDTTSCIVE